MRYPDVIGLSRADLAALLVAFFSPLVPFVFPAAIMLVHGVLSRLLQRNGVSYIRTPGRAQRKREREKEKCRRARRGRSPVLEGNSGERAKRTALIRRRRKKRSKRERERE